MAGRVRTACGFLWTLMAGATLPALGGGTSTGRTPINELAGGSYQGFPGGLYPGGLNVPPGGHAADAAARALQIVPRNSTGAADPNGWIVLLGIGMSNTCHEFSVFERQEDLNAGRNARVILVNGAMGGQSANLIADPAAAYWTLVHNRLAALNLTPEQVQVVWLKEANQAPPNDFPGHATALQSDLRSIVQILHDRFANLQVCYLSSRIYGGYSFGWEPQAYETGFSVKWLIEDQINGTDPGLNFGGQPGPVEAPLLLWGPYLWGDGVVPRADGLTWLNADLESDNVHPSPFGEQKVADLLSNFFGNEPTAVPWFAAKSDVALFVLDAQADAYTQASTPNTNFGTTLELHHQGGATPVQTYLRFDAALTGPSVLFAKLCLRTVSNNGAGGGLLAVASNSGWRESAITAANAPLLDGGTVATVPQASRDGTIAAEVSAIVHADPDGLLTFALTNPDNGLRRYHSREAGQPPRLVLVMAAGPPVPAVTTLGGVGMAAVLVIMGAWFLAQRRNRIPLTESLSGRS